MSSPLFVGLQKLSWVFQLKINKFGESESDVEIDVENDEFQPSASVQQQVVEEPETPVEEEVEEKVEIKEEDYMEPTLEYSEAVTEQLFDTKPPQAEVVLSDFNVTDLEKAVFPEFFDGRATKTPSRYLKVYLSIPQHFTSDIDSTTLFK